MPEVFAETLPAATVERLAHAIGTARLRAYLSTDVIGAALGGAMKNVFVLACGAADGMKLGEGARTTLITRGLAEMARLVRNRFVLPAWAHAASGARLERRHG